ncbi:MAG: hypothetical protein BWK73_48095 [Thiothrix lacustris]|uniref:Teneurin-like YD-shell domain-containing protein n=1 Tax=Thiothrix lacustris TaxID=525917 RepID=A0A1Y1Q9G0_9GAMM|nr:MAG: hypothetical protein BWK73_48095 [Thiothrix lacustris]
MTTNEYDPQNRLVKTTDPAGGITQYAYDAEGNRTTVIAANGATTAYTYDNFKRMTGEASPDRGNITNTHDISDNLKTSTDANGNTATYDYDLLNRKVKTTWQDGSIATWNYDNCTNGIGRLCTLTDGSGSTAYSYDTEGRITQKVQTIGNAILNHRYTHTDDGKLQSETLPSGATIGYTYTQDKLTGISLNGQAYMSNIRYTAAGQVASWQWADGTTYQKTYDANGRLKTFSLGGIVRTLSYDATGNIRGWDDNGDAAKAKHFSYDLLDRLDGYTAAFETQAFQYDPNGNRTATTDNGNTTAYGVAANSNRLTQIGSTAQVQDANGNLLNDGTHIYTYNAQNRLASVDGTTAYSYNADDQRVKKTVPTGTTLYAWDNDRIIGEYTTANGAAQQATETVYFGNTPVAVVQNGNIYRIHADQIDTPRVITDTVGKTVWAWDSKPFGETLPDEDPDKDGLTLHYSQRFPGQTFDTETGLHYNFHRDYNPATGRYVQSDPIGLDGGMNSFGYVGGNPLARTDLRGQWWQTTPPVQYLTVSYDARTRIVNINGRFRFYGNRNTSQLQTLFLNGMRNTWNRRVGIFDVRLNVSSDNASDRSIEITDNTRLSTTDSTTAWVNVVGGREMHLHNTRSSGWTAAHEFGHFLRLGDQYVEGPRVNGQRTNRVRPGREGTLMGSDNGRLAEIEVACTIDRSSNSNFKPEVCGAWNGR